MLSADANMEELNHWSQLMQAYIEASNVVYQPRHIQRATINTVIDPVICAAVSRETRDLGLYEDTSSGLPGLLDLVVEFINSKHPPYRQRMDLFLMTPQPGQSDADYARAVLSRASECNIYQDSVNDLIMSLIMSNLTNDGLRLRLIEMAKLPGGLQPDKCITACTDYCNASMSPVGSGPARPGNNAPRRQQQQGSRGNTPRNYNSFPNSTPQARRPNQPRGRSSGPPTPSSQAKCGGCNGNHSRKACPHAETICDNCGIKGHLRRVCRGTQAKKPTPTPRGKSAATADQDLSSEDQDLSTSASAAAGKGATLSF